MKQMKEHRLYGLVLFLVILFLDVGNIFTRIGKRIGFYEFIVIMLVVAVMAGIYLRLDVSIKMPIHSEIDTWVWDGLSALALYGLFLGLAVALHEPVFAWYKIIGTVIGIIACALLLEYRKRLLEKRRKQQADSDVQTNTYTLKDLYEGKVQGNRGEMVLLDEEAVDYDLLHREDLIDNIVKTVEECHPDKKFVLSLSGSWGSGKTTILNNVKRKLREDEKILVIDDFDPWNYEDEAALFGAILDTIFQYSGVEYSISKQRAWKRDLLALVFNISETTRGVKFSFLKEERTTIAAIRDKITEYLSLSEFRLVFIMDNIERLGPEKVLLLLKTVADVLNLDKVIYILSYDPGVLKNMLSEQHYGTEYLKKIVQIEFCLPELDKETKIDLLFRCANHILQLYEVDEKQHKEVLKCMPLIAEHIQDVRDIKRFLNSIMSVLYFLSRKQGKQLAAQLNLGDYIILEFIKRENRELYQVIWRQASYFVSSSRETMFGHEFLLEPQLKKKNEEVKAFYQKLFANEKNDRYKELLRKLFPYVEHYAAGKENILNYEFGDDNYEKTIRERRIYSGNFFPMYFTQHMNEHLEIQNEVESFMMLCRENKEEEAAELLKTACKRYRISEQTIMFEQIQLYTSDMTTPGWETLFDVLYDYVAIADDNMLFLRLDAKRRAIYILSLALEQVSEQYFENFLLRMKSEYSRMYVIDSVIWHGRVEGSEKAEIKYNGRAAKVYEVLKTMAVVVVGQKIDLYDDLYYRKNNIWGWYHAIRSDKNINVKTVFHYMLTPVNIYRFLWDMTGISLSGVYGYSLNEHNFKVFCDLEEIEKCISAHEPETEDEAFVQEIYDAYKNGTNESERTIYKEENVRLSL